MEGTPEWYRNQMFAEVWSFAIAASDSPQVGELGEAAPVVGEEKNCLAGQL
jgi:hypothetical protein